MLTSFRSNMAHGAKRRSLRQQIRQLDRELFRIGFEMSNGRETLYHGDRQLSGCEAARRSLTNQLEKLEREHAINKAVARPLASLPATAAALRPTDPVASLHYEDYLTVFAEPECAIGGCEHNEDQECPTNTVPICAECARIAEAMGADPERWTSIVAIAWPCATASLL